MGWETKDRWISSISNSQSALSNQRNLNVHDNIISRLLLVAVLLLLLLVVVVLVESVQVTISQRDVSFSIIIEQ